MRFSILAVAAFTVLNSAAPTVHPRDLPHVLHERRDFEDGSWAYVKPVPAGTKIPVRIGLTQSNLDKSHDLLMEITNHDSPKYGKHYTAEEVIELFAPHRDRFDAVSDWLRAYDIHDFSQSVNKQWVQFDIVIEELESLLKTKYHQYEHGDTGVNMVACDEYHLPAHIQEHIDYINPGIRLMTTAKRNVKRDNQARHGNIRFGPGIVRNVTLGDVKAAKGNLAQCGAIVTPECVMAMYNITAPTTSLAGNSLGIFEDAGQWFSQADMNTYFETFTPNIPRGTHPICKGIDGAVCENPVGIPALEGLLDLAAAYPIIYPQKINYFMTDDIPTNLNYEYYGIGPYAPSSGFFNNFFDGIDGSYCTYTAFNITGNSPIDPAYPDNMTGGYTGNLQCGVYKPTNVISISYGSIEAFPTVPVAYQKRQCLEILKLGLQGVSVVASSGDIGVGSINRYCQSDYATSIFAPMFPASCPYTITVGGTTLLPGKSAVKDQEVATVIFPSGGGFSNIWARPSYQNAAVNTFFNKYPPTLPYYETTDNQTVGVLGGLYNRIGRAYPDVAAVGDNYVIISEGNAMLVYGTSISAPIFASILTRINEARLLAGKSTVGFVNPVLYKHPDALHDITVGNNDLCTEGGGFTAGPGWDPVTGLGTPKFSKLMDLFMSMP